MRKSWFFAQQQVFQADGDPNQRSTIVRTSVEWL
jgi:hypothetical protein